MPTNELPMESWRKHWGISPASGTRALTLARRRFPAENPVELQAAFPLRLVEFHFLEAAEDFITRKTLQRVAESPGMAHRDNRRVTLLHRDQARFSPMAGSSQRSRTVRHSLKCCSVVTVVTLLALANRTGNRSHQMQEFFGTLRVDPIMGFLMATRTST